MFGRTTGQFLQEARELAQQLIDAIDTLGDTARLSETELLQQLDGLSDYGGARQVVRRLDLAREAVSRRVVAELQARLQTDRPTWNSEERKSLDNGRYFLLVFVPYEQNGFTYFEQFEIHHPQEYQNIILGDLSHRPN